MKMLEGKVAVVTGGTRGIGLAIVKAFLAEGASVALFGSRAETVEKALQSLKEENADYPVIGLAPDLGDYAPFSPPPFLSLVLVYAPLPFVSKTALPSNRLRLPTTPFQSTNRWESPLR